MKVTVIKIVIGALGTVTKEFVKGLELLEIRNTNGDHLNDSTDKIGLNTENCAGNVRRHDIIQTPVKDHQLMLV